MKALYLLLLLLFSSISIAQTTTWDGSSWSNGVPNNSTDAIITGNYDTSINGDFTAKNLSVSISGAMTITSANSITVQTNIDNLGNFTIEDKGSLVMIDDIGTVFGNYIVKKNTPDYTQVGSTSFFSSPMIESDSNITSIFNTDDTIFYWDASVSPTYWVFIPHEESPGVSNNLGLGRGYAVRADMTTGNITRIFSGEMNTGDVSVPVYYSDSSTSPGQFGYNIVGNPYPSAIDWFAFKADNASILSGTMYVWRQQAIGGINHASSYIALNSLGTVPYEAANEFIGSAQGFVVKTNATSNVVFKNSHRVSNNQQFFRNSNDSNRRALGNSWLKLEGATNKSTILIGFNSNATTAFDNDYDGIFIGGTDPLQLFSLNGTDKLLINGQPELTAPNDTSIPLGIKAAVTGNYTISIEEEFIGPEYLIKLEDTQATTITDLRISDYTFAVNSTDEDTSRFIIHYEYDTTLGIMNVLDEKDFKIFFDNDEQLNIIVEGGKQLPESFDIYDISGKLLFTDMYSPLTNTQNIASGIYLIRLNYKNLGTVSKSVVKK
jgi:hypothetical protein